MLSTCPHCKASVEHEDHLFEVTCKSCQQRFNPFLNLDGLPPLDGLEQSLAAPARAQTEDPQPQDWQESNDTLDAIRNYGEDVSRNFLNAPPLPAQGGRTSLDAMIPKTLDSSGGTAGERGTPPANGLPSLPFFPASHVASKTVAWHGVVSTLVELSDPFDLSPALAHLSQQAEVRGANALVQLQTLFSPDGHKLLLWALAATCPPEN